MGKIDKWLSRSSAKTVGCDFFFQFVVHFFAGRFVFRVIKTICSAYTIWDNHPMYKNNNFDVIWMLHFSVCVFFH